MKRKTIVIPVWILMFLCLLFPYPAFAAESGNPLIVPYPIPEEAAVSDRMINILLLGIDHGMNGYWGSGGKKTLAECHTDANMVVAINLDQARIDLISLPRDTVTYVPGVRGIYKLNGAINCADTLDEGLQKTKQAAEWLLGGVRIDCCFALDMETMIRIGDVIGGVDMALEMNYKGHSGTAYKKGMQHLDGLGITDYLRARTNATVNGTDIGRTNRNRQTMLAIFRKLRGDSDAVLNLIQTAASAYNGFVTDATASDIADLIAALPEILSVDPDMIGLHVLTGKYRSTLDWNFTYTDQDHRIAVLREVYGITAGPIPYVSTQYAQWLLDTGFTTVHYLSVAQEFSGAIAGYESLTEAQAEAVRAFEAAYESTASAFDAAAASLSDRDTSAMASARKALREAADACAQALRYPAALPWAHNRARWWEDTYVNECQYNWQ